MEERVLVNEGRRDGPVRVVGFVDPLVHEVVVQAPVDEIDEAVGDEQEEGDAEEEVAPPVVIHILVDPAVAPVDHAHGRGGGRHMGQR